MLDPEAQKPAAATTSCPPSWVEVARAADVSGDGPHAMSAGGVDLVALRIGGALRVFEGRCPHQGALLGEGELDGGTLVCRNHRWRFDGATGRREGGPECLRACPAEVRDDALWVDVAALRARATVTASRRKIRDLPGPRSLPWIGAGLQIEVPRLHLVLEGWSRTYGPIYTFEAPGKTVVAVSEPALIAKCLRERPETFRRDDKVEPVFAELGVSGVFSAEGAAWRPQRKLAMEALSHRHLKTFHPTLASVAVRLQQRLERAAASGQEVDIQDDLMRFTVDVTTALVFGHDLDTLGGGRDVIQRHLELVFPTFARRLNAIVPYWRLLRLPVDRRVDKAVAALRVWIAARIGDARARLEADPGRPPANFLESMLIARDDAGRPFSDEIVFGNLMTMLLAGEDTTANSLAWSVHLLCDHPDEVRTLRTELDAVLGPGAVPADLETTNRLERANAIAQEAMRLVPVAPLNFLQANHDTVLGDVEIPKGTTIVTLMRIPAMDERHFSTPDVFRPGRWLGEAEGAHEPGVLQPFGSGPRICPGRTLALVEMRIVLAAIYGRFDVTRVGPREAVEERYSFTVMPEGLRVRISPRRPAP